MSTVEKVRDKLLTKLIQDENKYNKQIIKFVIIKDYFKKMIENNKNVLLCYQEDNTVIGYVFFKYQENDDGKGYLLDGIYVEEEYRHKGIAKLLINEGLKRIKDYDYIDLNVYLNNTSAIKLYESFGFKPFSVRMRKI